MQYVDPAENFEDCARSWAQHLDTPFSTHGREFKLALQLLQTVFTGIYPETVEFIEADPVTFADTVARYRHATRAGA